MADPYLQGNGTFINLLGIECADELEEAEKGLASVRLTQVDRGSGPAVTGDCLADLKALHGFIFQDVYPWAGKTRAEAFAVGSGRSSRRIVTNFVTVKGKKVFAGPKTIATRLDRLTEIVGSVQGFKGLKRREFAIRLADVLLDINDVHPFREGNGRTQRAYAEVLARRADRTVDFTATTRERMIQASMAADVGDKWMMRRLIRDAASAERVTETKKARDLLEKRGFKDWNDRYVGFVEPGRRHRAELVGTSGRHFTCVEDRSSILIGWRRDLPKGTYRPGDPIDFIGRGAPTGTRPVEKDSLGL